MVHNDFIVDMIDPAFVVLESPALQADFLVSAKPTQGDNGFLN